MSSSAAQPGSHDPRGDVPPEPVVRAILVGRTGLDASLRRDAQIELARCRTPLEAIGELAQAPVTDANGSESLSPREAVIFAAEALPDDPNAFAEAARLLRGDAAIFLARDPAHELPSSGAEPPDAPAGFDGTLPPIASPDDFHDALARVALRRSGWLDEEASAARADAPSLSEATARPVASVRTPPPSASLRSAPPPPHQLGAGEGGKAYSNAPLVSYMLDSSLVQSLLAGRDLILPAITIIRERLGLSDVLFVPAPDAGDGAAVSTTSAATSGAPPGTRRVPVQHGGHLWGFLQSAVATADALEPHGRWLSPWLALQHQQQALQHAAMVDDLTGAFNRRYFDRFMNAAIVQAKRDRHALTLMVFDLDDFKSYNDRWGHPAGDDILRETVRLLRSVIRPSDRVCRIGGDEFAVVFYEPTGPRDPGSRPPDDPHRIAQRFQHQIREHRFPKLGGCAPGTLTVSAGIATYPWDGRSAAELLERADQLALESKRAGKNAITMGPTAEPGTKPCPP